MNVSNSLDNLPYYNYHVENYTENKAVAYKFLKKIQKTNFHLKPKQIELLLEYIKSFLEQKRTIETSSSRRFKKIVKKLQESIAIGSLVKDSLYLDKDYWLEALGMTLIIDEEKYKGHIYTGYLTESKYLEKWQAGIDENGVSYHEQYSFEEYLNQVVIPHLSFKEREELKAKCSIVEYYSPNELATLETHFDPKGNIYQNYPYLNAWVKSRAKAPESKESYSDFCQTYQPAREENNAERQYVLTNGTYMYLLDHQSRLYLQIKNRGKTNHTSLSNGKAVLAAGNLQVKEGKIIAIDTFSGHYKPTEIQLITFLEYLRNSNVDINTIKVTYVAEYEIQPWKINQIQPQDVQIWLDNKLIPKKP